MSAEQQEMWARVARAAADHHRIVGDDGSASYDDLDLRSTTLGYARVQLRQAIVDAASAELGSEEIIDALLSGSGHSMSDVDADELVHDALTYNDRRRELLEDIQRRMFGDRPPDDEAR